MAVKIPPIPAVPGDASPELARFLSAVKEVIEVRTGTRGSGTQRYLTLEELIEQGLGAGSAIDTGPFGTSTAVTGPDMAPPTNLVVAPSIFFHTLTWTNPTGDHFSHIEVWWNTSDDVSTSTLLAYVTKPIDGFKNRVGTDDVDRYYWIRAVSFYGKKSTWCPLPSPAGPGGYKVDGKDTVGQTIDEALDVLKGGDPSPYSSSAVYAAGDLVLYNGRRWRRKDYDIGASGYDPLDAFYWERMGILMTGDVDGQPTVGIDGNLVVDNTILARHIAADQIDGDHINAQSRITLNEGGEAVFGNDNVLIQTAPEGGGGQIVVAPDGGIVGNDYVALSAGDINFQYYDTSILNHVTYSSIKRIEAGVAANGSTVLIPGIWKEQPKIIVSPNNVPIYSSSYPAQDQTLVLAVGNLSNQPGSTIRWQFDAMAYLSLGSGAIGVVVNDLTSYVGADSTPPHQISETISPTSGDQITGLKVTTKTRAYYQYTRCSYNGEEHYYTTYVYRYRGLSRVRLHYLPTGGSWTYVNSPTFTTTNSWATYTFNLTGLSGVTSFYVETIDYGWGTRFYEYSSTGSGCSPGYTYYLGNKLVSYESNLGQSIQGIAQGFVNWLAIGT